MPTYNYTALNNNGSKKKGILSASSEREARKYIIPKAVMSAHILGIKEELL